MTTTVVTTAEIKHVFVSYRAYGLYSSCVRFFYRKITIENNISKIIYMNDMFLLWNIYFMDLLVPEEVRKRENNLREYIK
ncbi:hypothetical protein IKI14_07265 [bacterium]|nr:hypothetical protein [bacterium]